MKCEKALFHRLRQGVIGLVLIDEGRITAAVNRHLDAIENAAFWRILDVKLSMCQINSLLPVQGRFSGLQAHPEIRK